MSKPLPGPKYIVKEYVEVVDTPMADYDYGARPLNLVTLTWPTCKGYREGLRVVFIARKTVEYRVAVRINALPYREVFDRAGVAGPGSMNEGRFVELVYDGSAWQILARTVGPRR